MAGSSRPGKNKNPNLAASRVPSKAVMPTYARQDLVFERGEGAWLETPNGQRYLDFTSGIAVNALGHSDPRLVAAIQEQAAKLLHTSNLFRVAGQERLGERLCAATFADLVFFCNSGTEAVEGAIKTARRFHFDKGAPQRNRIIAMDGAFHGRTLAALAAGGTEKYREGFGPDVPGFDHVPFADLESLEKAIGPETAAIIIEPIQGEGGVRELSKRDLKHIRHLCDENEILLILDEVQSGMGRTGHLFAHQRAGITPDIMAIAKGLGGGFPVGAFLATNEAAHGMVPGTHGSTFGGNPLAMAAANTVFDIVSDQQFLSSVRTLGLRLRQSLAKLQDSFPSLIKDVRGDGLLIGLKLAVPPAQIVNAARDQKLLVVGASDNVVRILPPLNISEAELLEGVAKLTQAFASVKRDTAQSAQQSNKLKSTT